MSTTANKTATTGNNNNNQSAAEPARTAAQMRADEITADLERRYSSTTKNWKRPTPVCPALRQAIDVGLDALVSKYPEPTVVAAVNKEPHQPVAEPAPADSDPFGGDDAEELADAEDVPVEVEKKPMAKEQPPVKAPEVEKKPTAKEQPPVKAPEVEKKKAVEERPTPVPAPTANPLPPPQPPVVKEKEQQPKPVEQEPKKEVRVVEKESAPAAVPPAPVITEPETAKEKAQPEPEENVSEHEDDADSAPASPPHQEEEAAAEASADDDEEKEEDAADEKDRDEHDDDVMVVDDDHIDEAAEEDAPDIKKDEKKEKEVVPEKKKAPKKKASSKPRHKNTAGKFVDDQAEEEDEEDAADDDDEEDDAAGEPVDENGHAMKQDEDGRWSKFIVDGSSDEEGGAPVAAADEDEDDDVADEEEAAHPAEDGDDSDIDPEVSKRLEQNVGSFFGGWDLNSSGKKNKIIQCALEELAERKHQKTAVKAKEPAEKRRKKAPVTKAQVKIDSDKKEEETAAADEAVAADPEPKAEVAAAEEEKDAEEPEDEKKKKRDIPPRKRALPMDLKLGVNLPPDDGDAEKPKAAEVPVDAKPEIAPAAAPSSQIAGQKKDPFLAEAITFKRFCNMALVAAIIAGFKEVYGNEVQAEPYFKEYLSGSGKALSQIIRDNRSQYGKTESDRDRRAIMNAIERQRTGVDIPEGTTAALKTTQILIDRASRAANLRFYVAPENCSTDAYVVTACPSYYCCKPPQVYIAVMETEDPGSPGYAMKKSVALVTQSVAALMEAAHCILMLSSFIERAPAVVAWITENKNSFTAKGKTPKTAAAELVPIFKQLWQEWTTILHTFCAEF